jgi:hypothetical protein
MTAEKQSSTRAMLVLAVLVSAHLAAPASGVAQLDRAHALLTDAEFDRALRAYDDALAGPLDRAQLLEALEGRAMACLATGQEDRARADLAALAEIDPAHHFPLEAPPDLTMLYESIARERVGPLAIRARWTDDGLLVVSIENDSASLAQTLRVHVDGTAPIDSPVDGATTLEVSTGPSRSAWAELLGTSGAVLATVGEPSRPLVRSESAPARAAADTRGSPDRLRATTDDGSGDGDLWIALGVSGGALVVIGVVIAVALGVSSSAAPDAAQPSVPIVTWP